MGNCAAGVD